MRTELTSGPAERAATLVLLLVLVLGTLALIRTAQEDTHAPISTAPASGLRAMSASTAPASTPGPWCHFATRPTCAHAAPLGWCAWECLP